LTEYESNAVHIPQRVSSVVSAFWSLVALGVFVYAGYPLLLALLATLRPRRPVCRDESSLPSVTLLVSAYNEAGVIAEKLRDSLAIDYPHDRLQIMVISDASSDQTDDIASSFSDRGVELLRMPQRGGKTVGLNAALLKATGDIVVFSDANAMYRKNALRMITRNFADPDVGAVVGESTYAASAAESERSEGLYWRYETMIKSLESRVGSVVGGDGAIYAIRRKLYVPMSADALSDFVNPLQIVAQGWRCIYEREAQSIESAGDSFEKEFRRKVRIVNRAWRATWKQRALLNPLQHGLFAMQLWSHKLLRWLMPAIMLALLLVSATLTARGAIYEFACFAQVAFYLLAAIGHLLRHRKNVSGVLTMPYYFCLVNVASAIGIIDAFRGRTYSMWTTVRT
jgi:cellulose synthase/poly-beta-1,6-N-acetylglucosamine synthase-like glycosyltransferase